MKFSGLVPQTVNVNAVNASCKIILLFWNFGSGVYGLFLVSSSITAGCCGVPIWLNLAGVFSGIGDACTGLCIFFSFDPDSVTRQLAHYCVVLVPIPEQQLTSH